MEGVNQVVIADLPALSQIGNGLLLVAAVKPDQAVKDLVEDLALGAVAHVGIELRWVGQHGEVQNGMLFFPGLVSAGRAGVGGGIALSGSAFAAGDHGEEHAQGEQQGDDSF